jgi:hypothetical protein
MHRFVPGFAVLFFLVLIRPGSGRPEPQKEPIHLREAQTLVRNLKLVNTSYRSTKSVVRWKGSDGAVEYESRTDCNGFVNHLLAHSYGFKPAAMKRWLGKTRPTADLYYDKINEGVGFTKIDRITDARPGDLLAVKYIARTDTTGHIMLLASVPEKMTPRAPAVPKTIQWQVTVIDSSKSGHGPSDTRQARGTGGKDHAGLGRGVLRLYADAKGNVAGFSWSTRAGSKFVAPRDEALVIGRLQPEFKP